MVCGLCGLTGQLAMFGAGKGNTSELALVAHLSTVGDTATGLTRKSKNVGQRQMTVQVCKKSNLFRLG